MSDDTKNLAEQNAEVRQMIEDIRGGVPAACDLCRALTEPDHLEPEESGLWVCWPCIEKWEKTTGCNWADGTPKT